MEDKNDSEINIEDDPVVNKVYLVLKARRQCEICEITFLKEEELKIHESFHEIQCKLCNTEFSKIGGLERHNEIFHDLAPNRSHMKIETEIKCETCGIIIEKGKDIQIHKISTHGPSSKWYTALVQNGTRKVNKKPHIIKNKDSESKHNYP